MKKNIPALAAASLAAFSTAGHAQNAVTLYGLIDEGINFTTNAAGSRTYQMVSGNTIASFWGLKGSEDLGGGLSAIFVLENAFNASNGNVGLASRMFGRQGPTWD